MRSALMSVLAAVALVAPVVAQAPSVASQPAAGPSTWTVDSNHSTAAFSVKHMMISTVHGTLGPIKGTIVYDGKSIESIKADITIDVTAINTGSPSRDRDLRGDGFFDVTKYPTATFKSKRVETAGPGSFRMIGDLTMHGITKEVTLTVDGPSAAIKTQQGGLKVAASATTTLNRRDFGLQYNALVEAGPVVADNVQVTIDLEANKQG